MLNSTVEVGNNRIQWHIQDETFLHFQIREFFLMPYTEHPLEVK